jgi:hypothetical protein
MTKPVAAASTLAVPEDIQGQVLDLLVVAAGILEQAQRVPMALATADAAMDAFAHGDQPPLPPDVADPVSVRRYALTEVSGYTLTRDVLDVAHRCLDLDGDGGAGAQAVEVLAEARRFLARAVPVSRSVEEIRAQMEDVLAESRRAWAELAEVSAGLGEPDPVAGSVTTNPFERLGESIARLQLACDALPEPRVRATARILDEIAFYLDRTSARDR